MPVPWYSKVEGYSLKSFARAQGLALAVTSDGNIDQLGDGDDGDLSVQDDAEKGVNREFQLGNG